jgi:hypothetical protein
MNSHFIEDTLRLLQGAARFASTAEQRESIANSNLILFFILGRGEEGAFAKYLELFNTEALPPLFSFRTMEEADDWLRNHPEPPHGATIGAAGRLYTLAYSREINHRKLLHFPVDEGMASTKEVQDEAEEMAEAAAPPNPNQETDPSLFDYFNWTSFQLHELAQHLSSVADREAIRVAKIAFHFVMDAGEDQGFKEYLETFRAANASGARLSFPSRSEADAWLAKQPEPPSPAVVAIAGKFYSVGYNRSMRLRIMIRIPTAQELGGRVETTWA